MLCPNCKRDMVEISPAPRKNLRIDRCSSCGTLWFDCSELAEYLRSVRSQRHVEVDSDIPYRPRLDESVVHCPRCDGEALRACFLNEAQGHWCVSCFGFLVREAEIPRTHTMPTSAVAQSNLIEQGTAYRIAEAEAVADASSALGDFLAGIFDGF